MSVTVTEADALDAGLRYVSDESPGLTRRRSGSGFSFWTATGEPASDTQRTRARSLAIPPAWTEVWISPSPRGHIQATGRDEAGRKQYLYHPTWEELRDQVKYESMLSFAAGLGELRQRVDSDLRRRGFPKEKVAALVVAVMDATLIRVGNPTESDARGLTTLHRDDVEAGTVRLEFEFVGKGGADRRVVVSDRRLTGLVSRIQELPGQHLFTWEEDGRTGTIGSGDVNNYLRETLGGTTSAKDFRTWGGTVAVGRRLGPEPPRPDAKACSSAVLEAIDHAAELLGNTRTVCRTSYVHPIVPDSYPTGELHRMWQTRRQGKHLTRAERVVAGLLEG